ncbi:MAG: FecR family protein [Dysgonomonas sp.]|nr:FecR family protein [Dysgonomonas sp.]
MTKLNDEIIEQLITKYLAGEISSEEKEILEKGLDENEEYRKLFYHLKNIWEVANPPFNPNDIDTSKAYENIKPHIRKKSKKVDFIIYWQRIASIMLLPLLALSAYFILKDSGKIEYSETFQEIFTPYGSRSLIDLPDGSKVWLNAGSSLKYPIKFTDNSRKVFLEGEGYFEVQSDKENPFIVQTKSMDIKATGTKFNIEAYKNDTTTAVTLVSGAVDILFGKKEESLSPGERIHYNNQNSSYKVKQTDTFKWCSWKDGIYAFRNDPLADVFKKLGQTYNIDFIIKDKEIAQYVYRATFEGESLDQILHLLQVSAPIRYKKIREKNDNYYEKQIIEIYKAR